MEVHHHPQLQHKPKPWKEYFLEYLMIVLAVTTGFFAESLREHIADNHKEKEYMVSMLSDIKKDTLSFDQAEALDKLLIMGIDSAMNYLGSNLNNRDTAQLALIYFYKYCVNFKIFRPADGTIAQLKNNGGLRLVKDTEVVNKINIYYRDNQRLQSLETSIIDYNNSNNTQAGEIFNYMSNRNLHHSTFLNEASNYKIPLSEFQKWSKPNGQIILTTDAKVLSPFLNNLNRTISLMQNYIVTMSGQKHVAEDLMHTIKENYSLKNE